MYMNIMCVVWNYVGESSNESDNLMAEFGTPDEHWRTGTLNYIK